MIDHWHWSLTSQIFSLTVKDIYSTKGLWSKVSAAESETGPLISLAEYEEQWTLQLMIAVVTFVFLIFNFA